MRVGDIEDKGSVTLYSTGSLTTTFPTPSKKGILCKFTVKYINYSPSSKTIVVEVPSNINLFLWGVPELLYAGETKRYTISSEGSIILYYTYLF